VLIETVRRHVMASRLTAMRARTAPPADCRKRRHEFLIAAKRVALQRRHISFLVAAEFADRPALQLHAGRDLRRRRCVRVRS